ncbi:MAG: DUF11 domain-containing protein, partial [Ardenticatenales bacterium]|nr:DUF11 domain-containing protein [Ardenticatenales bacterium]
MLSFSRRSRVVVWLLLLTMLFNLVGTSLVPAFAQEPTESTPPQTENTPESSSSTSSDPVTDTLPIEIPAPDIAPELPLSDPTLVDATTPPDFPDETHQPPTVPPTRSFPTDGALGLALESSSAQAELGQVLTYHLVVGNQQNEPLTQITVRDTLPEGLVYLPGNSASLTYEQPRREITWQVAALQPGEVATATFQVRLQGRKSGDVLAHAAQASAAQFDGSVSAWSVTGVGASQPDQGWLTPNGGTLHARTLPVMVELPAQAVSQPIHLRLAAAPENLPALPGALTRFQVQVGAQPGQPQPRLDQPLRFVVDLAPLRAQLQAGAVPTLYRLSPTTATWESIASEWDGKFLSLSGKTTGAGTFAVSATSGEGNYSYGRQQLPTMKGFASDAFSGNSSFSYPLLTPPGPGGFGVNLGLSYSSESVNGILAGRQDQYNDDLENFNRQAGLLGWGWNLDGLGQVSYNSAENEYTLNYNGGSFKLLQPSQTGTPEWQTSPQSFLKVEYIEAGPSWKVWGADGTLYIFGDPDFGAGQREGVAYTPQVGVYSQTGERYCTNQLREAQLTRVISPLGNEIHIQYGREWRTIINCDFDLALRPQTITYMAAGATVTEPKSPTAQIVFNYEGRADTSVGSDDHYFLATKSNYRLADIFMDIRNVQGSFTRARTYHLDYQYDAFAGDDLRKSILLLNRITESGLNDRAVSTSLPAWTFHYTRLSASNPVAGIDWAGNPVSPSARANLNVLTLAQNGQGGEVRYEYELVRGIPYASSSECAAQQTARFRIKAMELFDGLENTQRTEYAVSSPLAWTKGGTLDNCARAFEFGGYGTVVQSLKDNGIETQRSETVYHQNLLNNNLGFSPLKGKPSVQRTRDPKTNAELQRAETTWAIEQSEHTRNSPWVFQSETRTVQTEGTTQVAHRTRYGYEMAQQNGKQYGNQTHIWEYTDDGQTLYRVRERWFFPNPTANITGNLAREYLYEAQGSTLLCKGDTVYFYDGQLKWGLSPLKGLLTLQYAAQNSCGGSWSSTQHTYDSWGNLIRVRDPRGYITTTAYDTLLRAYPVTASTPAVAAGQFSTSYEWDLLQGQVTTVIDPTGLRTEYRYDGVGRLLKMWQPGQNNSEQFPTQSFEYLDYSGPATPMRILQRQRLDVNGTSNETVFYQESYTFHDGLGQAIQTRTTSPSGIDKHVVTLTRFNATGQPYQVYAPVEDAASSNPSYRPTSWFAGKPMSVTKYDALGRPTEEIAPDGKTRTEHRYGLENGLQWHDIVDANRHRTQYRTDLLGRMVQVLELSGDCGSYWGYNCTTAPHTTPWTVYATTQYSYDIADRLVKVTDAQSNETILTYDLLGRKTVMDDPDMGIWHYSYDAASNLLSQTDARGCQISFGYDALSRLTSKNYTANAVCAATSPVTYRYDNYTVTPTAGHRALVPGQRTEMYNDVSSAIWNYDVRNRVVREVKTIKDMGGTNHSFRSGWSYDSANRVRALAYPSNNVIGGQEAITPEYGPRHLQLEKVSGSLNGVGTTYAQALRYNAQGQMVSLQYGTSPVRTQTYQYYPLTSAGLGRLQVAEVAGIKKWGYEYDATGNVLAITDYSDYNLVGIPQMQRFSYDHRDRLITAEAVGGLNGLYARETYGYDLLGNLKGQGGTSYKYTSTSTACRGDQSRPHTVREATTSASLTQYCYDASGNLAQRIIGANNDDSETMSINPAPQSSPLTTSDVSPSIVINPTVTRNLVYDVENRLVSISETGSSLPNMSMAYDGDGNRVRLTEGNVTTLYVGSHFEYQITPSAQTPTRYYYLGSQRIALRVGSAAPE